MSTLQGGVPSGDPATAWERRLLDYRLVSPLNRRKFTVIVVGTGLAGAGCATALGELGYHVECFTFHDAPRRAHSVAAQGGVNAARGRKVDNDSVARFVKDTVKGGDFRGREADCYRLGYESSRVIDHMNAIGAPFAREYGGSLATRSFGGVQVSRTYYTRGQTGQQLQIAASQALLRQVQAKTVNLHTRSEMLDLVIADGRAVGIVTRDLVTGEVAKNSNASATWRAHLRGALFASPSFIQFHPTALPVNSEWQSKTILMSESLRNDGRIWVPARAGDDRSPSDIPEAERDYYLERMYPAFGNLSPRDVSSRAARAQIDSGHERYGNLFEMYRDATGEDPFAVPMRIAPGAHFSMGGLWSDFDQMTTIPGLFVAGEAGWAYHGANRLGANSLLSACVDGWFTLPFSVPNYLAGLLGTQPPAVDDPAVVGTLAEVRARVGRLLSIGGSQGPDRFHRRLGDILYRGCGVSRSATGLRQAIAEIDELTADFWTDLRVAGMGSQFNQELEKAGRVADFLGLARLMCIDALDRDESCGAHFRDEHQTAEGEAERDDDRWCFVSAWEHGGDGPPVRHEEPLEFTAVPLATRNYK